ncbi:MAG: dihydrofolate reductase family protein, partial [Candidatus Eiseniibacteriota bacterium]
MSKVFVNLGMTLDGQIAGPNRGPRNPLGDRGLEIHEWLFQQRAFRELLKLGEGGETGADNKIVEQTFGRIGANVMGKRMFQEGEASWPEEAPFHSPVYVLTRE